MSKIWYRSPYSLEGNLGKSYNEEVELIPNSKDWCCLIDGDTAFINKAWGHHFQALIEKYPDAGLITTLTNRVGNLEQCYQGKLSEDGEIRNHRKIALDLQESNYLDVKKLNKFISGHIMLFQKSTWEEVGGFPEKLSGKSRRKYDKNIATVDNRFSYKILKAGKSILLAQGFYVFHYYRMIEGRLHRKHLGHNPKKNIV